MARLRRPNRQIREDYVAGEEKATALFVGFCERSGFDDQAAWFRQQLAYLKAGADARVRGSEIGLGATDHSTYTLHDDGRITPFGPATIAPVGLSKGSGRPSKPPQIRQRSAGGGAHLDALTGAMG